MGSHPLGRAARALVVTGLLVALTTSAHTLGGGTVSAGASLVLTLLVLPAIGYAVERRLGARALLLLLGAGQGLGHALLAAMAPSAHGVAERLPGHLALHDTVALALVGTGVVDHAAVAGGHGGLAGGHGGLTMLLAHALATVILAVLLAKGEEALWAVVARLLPTLEAPAPLARPRLTLAAPPRVGRSLLLLSAPVARGPPVTV